MKKKSDFESTIKNFDFWIKPCLSSSELILRKTAKDFNKRNKIYEHKETDLKIHFFFDVDSHNLNDAIKVHISTRRSDDLGNPVFTIGSLHVYKNGEIKDFCSSNFSWKTQSEIFVLKNKMILKEKLSNLV